MSNQKKNFLKKLALLTVTILLNKETFAVIRDYNEASSSSVVPVSQPTMRPAIDPKYIQMGRNCVYLEEANLRRGIVNEESAEFKKLVKFTQNIKRIDEFLQNTKKEFNEKIIQEESERQIQDYREMQNETHAETLESLKKQCNEMGEKIQDEEKLLWKKCIDAHKPMVVKTSKGKSVIEHLKKEYNNRAILKKEYDNRVILRNKLENEVQKLSPLLME